MRPAPLALVGPGGRLPLDRRTIEALAQVFVGMLDIAEPDPDLEEDDPQGEITDDDPAFDARSRAIANRTGSGPGCKISDPDYGAEEAGEFDEGEYGHMRRYGVDQSRSIGPDNPEVA